MHTEQENVLEITVRLGCPVLCDFCPQELLVMRSRGSSKRTLSAADLETIITNSTRRRPLRVVFAGFAEPFSVKHIRGLLDVCESHDRVQRITMFTTGEGLSVEDLVFMARLRKLYPDELSSSNRYINFHVRPRSDYALMKGARGVVWDMTPAIAELFPRARFVCVAEDVTPEHVDEMQRELSRRNLYLTTRPLVSRAGNVTRVGGRTLATLRYDHPVSCTKVHDGGWMPVVLPDGSAHACCNDYGCELPVGNLLTGTWESLDFLAVRASQDDPTSDLPCFRGCHFAQPKVSSLQRGS